MSIPAWILEIFAAVMILVAEVSAGQLAAARAWTRRGRAGAGAAVARLLTGIALADMLLPGLSILPNAAWEVVFAVMTAWFAWCVWRDRRGRSAAAAARGRDVPHLVRSAVVLYLFAALGAPSAPGPGMSMPGMAGGASSGMPVLHAPTLALAFALLLIAFTVRDLDRRADADGYFRLAGRPPAPAASTLAVAAAGPAPGARTLATAVPRQPAQADVAAAAPRADDALYTAERLLLSPAMTKACQVATGVTIAFTLIIMI